MLRYEVLECFAYEGKLSKSMVEKKFQEHVHITKTNRSVKHHRPEILDAFEYLKTCGWIDELNTDPGQGLVYGRGRPKTYYKITEKGLKELIAYDTILPLKFWKILFGYCLNNDNLVTLDQLQEFFDMFLRRYLKYANYLFSFQLELFHDLCDMWFQENKSDKITSAQKVIEVLAMNPKITFERLLQETAESESNIRHVLSLYSYISKPFEGPHESYYKEHSDFLVHNIVTTTQNDDGKPTYDLSLFGIMLYLVLLRYNEMDRLKGGLYFKDFSLQQYYDKTASKYKEKLPLIFGKWNQLKRILKLFTAYNLDIVIDKEIHYNNADLSSVTVGGNKELYEGIKIMILYNGKLMRDFADAGLQVLKNYIRNMFMNLDVWKKPETKKIYPLCAKFEEVMMLLRPTSFAYPSISMFNFATLTNDNILLKMEKSFADEITAFYYMNLHNDYSLQVGSLLSKYHHFSETDKSKLPDCTPKQCLSSILQEDSQIKEWFSIWMDDLVRVQEEILQKIKAFSDNYKNIYPQKCSVTRETMSQ